MQLRGALIIAAVLCILLPHGFTQTLTLPTATSGPANDKNSPEIASHDTPTTFTSRVNLVMVPVVVRDKQGNAVGTLTKDDFQLFDKGKLQVISKFSVEKSDRKSKPQQISDAAATAGEENPASMDPIADRFVLYLFDDMHLSFGDLAPARVAAKKNLMLLTSNERAAVFTTSGQTMLDFTDDREKLVATMDRIVPRSRTIVSASFECPNLNSYQADLIQNKNDTVALQDAIREIATCAPDTISATAAEAMARSTAARVLGTSEADTQVSLSVIRDSIRRISAMPGQRAIVLISPGFLIFNQREDQTELLDRAIRANVTISSLDARGLYVGIAATDASQRGYNPSVAAAKDRYQREGLLVEGDVLGELADGTGGSWVHNTNDLEGGLRRLATPPEFLYVLGFSPQNLKFNGAFHALKVTLKDGRGFTIQARRGYYSPKHEADPAEEAKQEIREALFSREEINDIPVEMQTQFFKVNDQSAKLAIVARVDLKRLRFVKAEGRNKDSLKIVSGIFDRDGKLVSAIEKTIDMRLKEETFEARLNAGIAVKTSFDVPPGNYVVRVVVRDSEGQTMAARNGVVQIPY